MKYRGKNYNLCDLAINLSQLQVAKLHGDPDKMSDHDECTIAQFKIMWDLLDIVASRDPGIGLMFSNYFDQTAAEFDGGETVQ